MMLDPGLAEIPFQMLLSLICLIPSAGFYIMRSGPKVDVLQGTVPL